MPEEPQEFDPDPELGPIPPIIDPLQTILVEMQAQRKMLEDLARENQELKTTIATRTEQGWASGVPANMRRGDPNTAHLTSENAARRVVIATRASVDDPQGFREYGRVMGSEIKKPSGE